MAQMTKPINGPAIDILLAVYNGERYLRPFLDSLVAQSFTDFRLVVSDNKSTDDTVAILNEYGSRFAHTPYIMPPPIETTNVYINFARVTEAGEAPYIMYADADDVWHTNKVEKTFAAMKKAETEYGASAPILVHSDLKVVDKDLNCLHPSFWRYASVDPVRRRKLNQILPNTVVSGCTMMVNRPLFLMGRPMPHDAHHDCWYALIAAVFGHLVVIEEQLIEYRQHGTNMSAPSMGYGTGLQSTIARAKRAFAANGAREHLQYNIRQTQIFWERFQDRIKNPQRRVVEAFATIPNQNALVRRWRLIRYGFWKVGFARNAGMLLVV
jgi:glycosyltransferase involved in cell wall biosynthesis